MFPRLLAILTACLCFPATVTFGQGQSTYEKDLDQLMAKRDREIAQATNPIMLRFKDSAQDLLKRAMQAGDLPAAKRIETAIGGVKLIPTNVPTLRITDLKTQMVGSTWRAESADSLRPGLPEQLTFTTGVVQPPGYAYDINDNVITIHFLHGDTQRMTLNAEGKRLQLTWRNKDYAYELVGR